MSERGTFVERALNGDVLLDAIDDEIAAWHDAETDLLLPAWLGLTDEEYALFVEKPGALRAVLLARKHGLRLHSVLRASEGATTLAARGVPPEELRALQAWLRKTGRI